MTGDPKRLGGGEEVPTTDAHVDALISMNAPLRTTYETLRAFLSRAGDDEVRARYGMGTLIAEVKRSEHKYGTHSLVALAKALGIGVQTLYRCACVAERWTDQQVEALLARRTKHGQALSWSHFVLLTNVASVRGRADLAERCIAEGLSVRQLATIVNRRRNSGLRGTLEGYLRDTERWRHAARRMHAKVFREVEAVASVADDAHALLDAAIAAQEALLTLGGRELERLRAQRDRLRGGSAELTRDSRAHRPRA